MSLTDTSDSTDSNNDILFSNLNTDNHNPSSSQDDLWFGSFQNNKPSNTFRILFHNINGLQGRHAFDETIPSIINDQQILEIDHQGITEHCLNLRFRSTAYKLQNSIKTSTERKTHHQFSCGNLTTSSEYLPGGTASITMGNAVGRISPQGKGSDRMGRWTYTTFNRTDNTKLTIITAYQVNRTPTNQIGITAWHQQRLQLDQEGKTSIHPRKAFIDDLIKFITEKQQSGHSIIVGGDFNETIDKQSSGILRLITATNLIDPWSHRFPHTPSFNTYSRGSDRIDHVFCTPSLISSIQSIGYAPFRWITNSDHRALLIDFNINMLFHGKHNSTTDDKLKTRHLKTNDKKALTTFINQL